MRVYKSSIIKAYFVFLLFLTINISFWVYSKNLEKIWSNVPEAPSQFLAEASFLGDKQFAYRSYAYLLQNLGNVDGRTISLKEYDYSELENWFFLEQSLDSRSDIVPTLAAYYFGAVKENEKLEYVLNYLSEVGKSSYGEKWRWLGHAVYLARHQIEDNSRALELAYELAANENPSIADWAKQMPVFILNDNGDGELAYKIMLNLLVSNIDTMDPAEVYFTKEYICDKIVPNTPSIETPSFCFTFK